MLHIPSVAGSAIELTIKLIKIRTQVFVQEVHSCLCPPSWMCKHGEVDTGYASLGLLYGASDTPPSEALSAQWHHPLGVGVSLGVTNRKPRRYLYLSRNFDLHRWRLHFQRRNQEAKRSKIPQLGHTTTLMLYFNRQDFNSSWILLLLLLLMF